MRFAAIGPILLIVACLCAQDFTHFEVASIRPSAPPKNAGTIPIPNTRGGVGTDDPGQINYEGIQLGSLIVMAYNLEAFQVLFSPNERPSPLARFDIAAKIPPGATKQQFNVMLQNLLADRFHLRVHHETRDADVYVLIVGPKGPKLKKTPLRDDNPSKPQTAAMGALTRDGFPVLPPGFTGVRGIPKPGRMYLSGRNVGVSDFIGALQMPGGRPILDQTGLTDHYDFDVEFEWLSGRGGTPSTDPAENRAPSVFTMVQQDLGLKLEPKKVPFDYLVVDNLDKEPTEN